MAMFDLREIFGGRPPVPMARPPMMGPPMGPRGLFPEDEELPPPGLPGGGQQFTAGLPPKLGQADLLALAQQGAVTPPAPPPPGAVTPPMMGPDDDPSLNQGVGGFGTKAPVTDPNILLEADALAAADRVGPTLAPGSTQPFEDGPREAPPLANDRRAVELAGNAPSGFGAEPMAAQVKAEPASSTDLMPPGTTETVARSAQGFGTTAATPAQGLMPAGTNPTVARDPANDPAMTSGGWKLTVADRIGLLSDVAGGIADALAQNRGGKAYGGTSYAAGMAARRKEAGAEAERRENRAYKAAEAEYRQKRYELDERKAVADLNKPTKLGAGETLYGPTGEVIARGEAKPPTSEAAAIASGDERYIGAYRQVREAQAAAARARASASSPAEMARVAIMQRNADIAERRLALDMDKAAGKGEGGPDIKTRQGLRKEFSDMTAEDRAAAFGYSKVKAGFDQKTGAGDIAGIFGFMKILDPTSVVREGEYATAANAGGVPERIIGLYNKAVSGEKLSDEQRSELRAAAEGQLGPSKDRFKAVAKQYADYATRYKIDPAELVGPDPFAEATPAAGPAAAAAAPGAPPAAAAPPGAPAIQPGGKAAARAALDALGLEPGTPGYEEARRLIAQKYGLAQARPASELPPMAGP